MCEFGEIGWHLKELDVIELSLAVTLWHMNNVREWLAKGTSSKTK